VSDELILRDFFEELKASGSVRSGGHSCQSWCLLTKNNKHRDTHIHPLQEGPKAIFFLRVQQPYIGGNRERWLRILQNWAYASFLL
jgi:hypothetical protein